MGSDKFQYQNQQNFLCNLQKWCKEFPFAHQNQFVLTDNMLHLNSHFYPQNYIVKFDWNFQPQQQYQHKKILVHLQIFQQ